MRVSGYVCSRCHPVSPGDTGGRGSGRKAEPCHILRPRGLAEFLPCDQHNDGRQLCVCVFVTHLHACCVYHFLPPPKKLIRLGCLRVTFFGFRFLLVLGDVAAFFRASAFFAKILAAMESAGMGLLAPACEEAASEGLKDRYTHAQTMSIPTKTNRVRTTLQV